MDEINNLVNVVFKRNDMAVVSVQNTKGENVSQVELADSIFNVEVKPGVVHEVVKMQLQSKRAGTVSVKGRSDIRGSQRKLFRQKGTGRARRGNIKSPLLRGGGVVFGPSPKDYRFSVNKKKKKLALKMALSSKFQGKQLIVLDSIDLDGHKTKNMVDVLKNIDVQKTLIIIDEENTNLILSARNLSGVKVLKSEGLNVYDILKYHSLVLLEKSISRIEGRF